MAEVVGVSSDSDVFSVRPSPDYTASDVLQTVTEYMCVPSGPQRVVSQIERHLRYEGGIQITPKGGRDLPQQQGRSPLMRGSSKSACGQSCWSAKVDKEAWYGPTGARRGREIWEEGGRSIVPVCASVYAGRTQSENVVINPKVHRGLPKGLDAIVG